MKGGGGVCLWGGGGGCLLSLSGGLPTEGDLPSEGYLHQGRLPLHTANRLFARILLECNLVCEENATSFHK